MNVVINLLHLLAKSKRLRLIAFPTDICNAVYTTARKLYMRDTQDSIRQYY